MTDIPPNKRRRSAPRVKSGCKTWIRRVKCDEGKPACLRCRKFGTECDGYEVVQPKSEVPGRRLLPKSLVKPYISPQPSIAVFGYEEQPYFQLFCTTTIVELAGYFDTNLWSRLVLQACHQEPAICKAVIAIAALTKTKEAAQGPIKSQVIWNESQTAERHHQFALQQYRAALKLMTDQLLVGKHKTRQTLIWCLLIYCFETYRGDYKTALGHAHSGLKMLREWLDTQPHSSTYLPGLTSPAPDIVEDELVQAFTRLDCEVMTTSDPRPSEDHVRLKDFGAKAIESMPSEFSTLQEAKIYCDLITQRSCHFLSLARDRLQGDENHEPHISTSAQNIPIAMDNERQRIVKQALLWNAAFEPFFNDCKTSARQHDLMGATVLRAHAKICLIGLQTRFETAGEMTFDNYESVFAEILTLATSAIELWNEKRPITTGAKFSPTLGIVFNLFWVAVRCRNRKIRHEAIRLLEQSRCREGIWDSLQSAKMASWLVKAEESGGLEGDYLPAKSRMRIVSCNTLPSRWEEVNKKKREGRLDIGYIVS